MKPVFTKLSGEAPDRMAARLLELGVRLPLFFDPECTASLVDADGRPVLTIDINRERDDEDAGRIATACMSSINVCGGFVFERLDAGDVVEPEVQP